MEEMEQPSDRELIDRCLMEDNHAWQVLHDRHDEMLHSIIWYHLGEERYDRHLVEDIAQMVWLSLLCKDYDSLRRYEPKRSCFHTYLRDVAKQTIKLHYRLKSRRLQAVSLDDHDPADRRAENGLVRAQFAEYEASLTPQEKRFVHEKRLKDAPETTQAPLSAGNERWLKHRAMRKWNDHFDMT
jgi:DNA-directed RNA polymerase specialized sigma24 family protein